MIQRTVHRYQSVEVDADLEFNRGDLEEMVDELGGQIVWDEEEAKPARNIELIRDIESLSRIHKNNPLVVNICQHVIRELEA